MKLNDLYPKRESGDFGPTWPEVSRRPMSTREEPRELTRPERAAMRKLVVDMCANYDRAYGCLPFDCTCIVVNMWWTGALCKYFQRAVLPLDPILEASLLGREAPAQEVCAVCGKSYIPDGKQTYCGAACQTEGNRRKSRERMRKKRRNGKA